MSARLLSLLACGLALAAAPLRGAEPAADLPKGHLDGYVAMVNADRARDRGQYKAAVRAYREALLHYQQVGRDNPQWHPEIVQYRTAYCTSQIENLLRQAGKTEAELMAEADAAEEGDLARARAKYADLVKQHTDQLAQLDEVNRAVKQLQGDVLARDGEIARLREEINRARNQLLASTNTMATANQLAQNVVASLEEENVRLKRDALAQADVGKLAAQEFRRLQAEMEALAAAHAQVREQHAAAAARLAKFEQQGRQTGDELAALRKEADSLRARGAAHAGELKQRDDQIQQLKAEQQRLAGDRNAASAAQAQLEKLATQSGRDLEGARNELASARAQLTALEQRHRVAQGDVDRLAASDARSREELTAAAKQRDEATAGLAKARAELDKTATELDAARKAQAGSTERLAGWDKERTTLTQELVRAQADAKRLDSELAAARKLQGEREIAFGQWDKERTTLTQELVRAQADAKRLDSELTATRKLQGEREIAFGQWDKERNTLTQELARAQADLASVRAELTAAQAQRGAGEKAVKELAQLRGRNVDLEKELAQTSKDLESVQAAYRKISSETEPLRDAAQEHQAEIGKREAELARRAAEITDMKAKVKEAVATAESRTAMHEALLENYDGTRKRLAEVTAQLNESDRAVREAQAESGAAKAELAKRAQGDSAQVAAVKAELAQAREELQKAEKRAAALTETVDARGRELAEARRAGDALKQAQGEIKALRTELEKAAETIARQEQRIKSLQK